MATVIFKRTDDQNTVPVVDGQLVFDETNYKIYMDYHNGKYGINTSANRGADTFFPFKSGIKRYNLGAVASGTNRRL